MHFQYKYIISKIAFHVEDRYKYVLERCNPRLHVSIRHQHAQSARVCRTFSARQSRDAPIGLLR